MYRHKFIFSDKVIIYISLAIVFLAIVICVALPIASNYHEETYVATVIGKDIKSHSNPSKYLVYTKTDDDKTRIFSVEDVPMRLSWNSSKLYSEIEVGKTYRFTTIGFRIEFLRIYENIINFQEISSGY